MRFYITANKGWQSEQMDEPTAWAYSWLLLSLGNYNVRVHYVAVAA